ncbi:3 beta-hydroxysteroid dehydrogenase/Delta 5--_4-isomerase [Pirellula sp. SH-Sr6A]|uniref:NAD-dependent epimerase/dehydratase family protein n=1 Tax=Pirellula sp. SH-Sr6A TaxID=1632865 RepID=UPI00078DD862|nr:NAD-dependent epimerase/dehydratase family protein [Pirellula sp. SH-Sr6A]AMV34801.1 3 beta-hydroxysteroid dehydrogenase/Delta 5-->4-isomerase [Pirellula sp. SH-Sr6A]
MKVLVTGYGGFLGKAICRQLLAKGYRVRGLARGRYPEMEALGVEAYQGSAADRSACEVACRDVDAVIHTAALAGVWGPARDFVVANIEATENLLACCQRFQVGNFVFTSSPSVTFDGSPQSHIDESVPYPTNWLCHYPRTKAIAEQKVLAADSSQLRTCALRPHLIWGKGDPHLIPRVIARCRQGRLLCVGDGKNLIDTVHVDAAAAAHVGALQRLSDKDSAAAGRPYFITDGAPQECWAWISTILAFANLTPPKMRIPLALAYSLGAALEGVYALLRKSDEPPMTRFVAKQLGVDHYFRIHNAIERLGYRPPENREELVAELVGTLAD